MPELPEVETTRRGIEPHVKGKRVTDVIVRQRQLRWPIPKNLKRLLVGQVVSSVERRAKYLLLTTKAGTAIVHLGMSGSLRVVNKKSMPELHDHVDIVLSSAKALRLRDPRRFGALLWVKGDPMQHALLKGIGPEPLDDVFDAEYLYRKSRGRRVSVKQFIMNSHIVAGVGNIYASEALFLAGINPVRQAGRVSRARYVKLVGAIKHVLTKAIKFGGTTLRDFTHEDGKPGYFANELNVYGRQAEPCPQCGTAIKLRVQGQRATYYCALCQAG